MSTPTERDHVRRMKIRLAALRRHAAARGPDGKSELAVAAGKASARGREDEQAWGLEMAIRRWHPEPAHKRKSTAGMVQATSRCPSKEVIDSRP